MPSDMYKVTVGLDLVVEVIKLCWFVDFVRSKLRRKGYDDVVSSRTANHPNRSHGIENGRRGSLNPPSSTLGLGPCSPTSPPITARDYNNSTNHHQREKFLEMNPRANRRIQGS